MLMATYLIGDLQGCFDELQLLLEKVNFHPTYDELWLVGDIVARGNKSLNCLRFVYELGDSAKMVLGNHDLHLLTIAAGLRQPKKKDKLDAIFEANDRQQLFDWLRKQPLLRQHPEHHFIMCHAGISPEWDLAQAQRAANELTQALQQDSYRTLLQNMYGNMPDHWQDDLTGIDRYRYIINSFTRMRFCHQDKRLELNCKAPLSEAPAHLLPWFQLDNPLYESVPIVFGHWASLVGESTPEGIYALDSGCVWGNYMTMLRWEDKQYFYQPALHNYCR